MKRILILGGGFGGAYCARTLERLVSPSEAEIVLIDRRNNLQFYPLLVEAGTGSLEPRHVVVPIRTFLRRSRFVMAEVDGVDPARREISFTPVLGGAAERLGFDHLVLALGSVTSLPAVPGLKEHAWEMKSLGDAVALRDRAIIVLEAADAAEDPARRRALLHFVVVGGSFTGAEVAGEFHVFLRQAARRYARVRPEEIRVTLIERGDRILPALDADLSEFAREHLGRLGIDVRLGRSVSEIGPHHVRLDDGSRLDTSTVIWCAGIAQNPVIPAAGLPAGPGGYLPCERDFSVKGIPGLWGIGDCALNPDRNGEPYPATAQHALRQGVHLARNIARTLKGAATLPFDYDGVGTIAALGCRSGVAKLYGFKISGFAAWWAFRTVYLMKMPGIARKLRLAIDWALELLFPRDYVQLGVHRGSGEAAGARGGLRSVALPGPGDRSDEAPLEVEESRGE